MSSSLSIMIVEDDEILSRSLAAAIEDRDCVVAGAAASVDSAMDVLSKISLDAAILDANLLDRNVTPVAMELIHRAIPFVIFTGFGLPPELSSLFPHVSVIMKPTDPDEVVAHIIEQVKRLQSPAVDLAVVGSEKANLELMGFKAKRFAETLFRHFGEEAVVLAKRQAGGAEREALEAWLAIIDELNQLKR